MMKTFWIFLVGISCISAGEVSERCPHFDYPYTETVRLYKDTCYQFIDKEMYWPQAKDYCKQRGRGKLVMITDSDTNNFIKKSLNSLPWTNEGVWIGLNDKNRELEWRWARVDSDRGELLGSWTNWGEDHPEGFLHGARDCIRITRGTFWKWHETPCSSLMWRYRFICQRDARPLPTTTTKAPARPGVISGRIGTKVMDSAAQTTITKRQESTTIKTTTPDPYDTWKHIDGVGPVSSDDFKCPDELRNGGQFPDGKDCSKYFMCVFGIAYRMPCGEKELFDLHDLMCTKPEEAKCYSDLNNEAYAVVGQQSGNEKDNNGLVVILMGTCGGLLLLVILLLLLLVRRRRLQKSTSVDLTATVVLGKCADCGEECICDQKGDKPKPIYKGQGRKPITYRRQHPAQKISSKEMPLPEPPKSCQSLSQPNTERVSNHYTSSPMRDEEGYECPVNSNEELSPLTEKRLTHEYAEIGGGIYTANVYEDLDDVVKTARIEEDPDV